jgi:hypothetical protein
MKTLAILAALLAMIVSSSGDPVTLEDISPHLSTNAPIVWQASMDNLPKTFWIYKKTPQTFSATTISNGIVLASFQSKGFPKPSTHQITIWGDHMEGEPEPPYFSILPDLGQMSFTLGDRGPQAPELISTNEAAVERAWGCLAELKLDRSQFVKTNTIAGGYGVFLPRQIDGIEVYGNLEGFQIQLAKQKVVAFCLVLPKLERDRQCAIASKQQIMACIRAFKTPSLPQGDEPDYFGRIKNLARMKKLTIVKITPYYSEGIYGEVPRNDEPPKIIIPIAELEALADFGNSNTTVRLVAPILASEANRLLEMSSK